MFGNKSRIQSDAARRKGISASAKRAIPAEEDSDSPLESPRSRSRREMTPSSFTPKKVDIAIITDDPVLTALGENVSSVVVVFGECKEDVEKKIIAVYITSFMN
tara:strand:+ start:744 stop:1055 length:312 start_codon:yes stop_codon:yes gene_type:complete